MYFFIYNKVQILDSGFSSYYIRRKFVRCCCNWLFFLCVLLRAGAGDSGLCSLVFGRPVRLLFAMTVVSSDLLVID